MNLKELLDVLILKRTEFIFWILANLGSLLISILAALTILLIHNRTGNMLPTKEAFLATGTISICIAGSSYHKTKKMNSSYELNNFIKIFWPFLLMIVYGVLIAYGVEKPCGSETKIFIISCVLFILCLLFSSIIWLQIQAMEMDSERKKEPPEVESSLKNEADTLPKLNESK
jgi:hypothetical protein